MLKILLNNKLTVLYVAGIIFCLFFAIPWMVSSDSTLLVTLVPVVCLVVGCIIVDAAWSLTKKFADLEWDKE